MRSAHKIWRGGFGRIVNELDARIIQFGLKVRF